MASMGGGHISTDQLVLRIREGRLLNSQLKVICSGEGLRTTGVKQDLQVRIIDHIRSVSRSGDKQKYDRLTMLILEPSSVALRQQYRDSPYSSSPSAPSPVAQRSMGNYGAPPVLFGPGANRIQIKPSPFYEIVAQIGSHKTMEVMKEHRNTVSIQVKPSSTPLLETFQTDKSLRILAFCAADGQVNPRDIAFPHNSELRVNGGDVKANLRGLKNKPGSTRAVDITDAVRLRPKDYPNNVELTYALSDKKFIFMIHIVKMMPVTDLVRKLTRGKRISKITTINNMVKKAEDNEIEATSMVLSLKCPLSTLRISLPCRSTTCKHNQCFDATSYLQLQEQGPTWLCPICNNSAPFECLAVDEYVNDILSNTSKTTDQVTIEPNGEWSKNGKTQSLNVNGAHFSDDDELIEIKDTRIEALRQTGTPASSNNSIRTPPTASREASVSVSGLSRGSTSAKRPAAEVIDLTFSDDDEEPVRAPKRQQFTGFMSGPQNMSDPRRTG